MDATSLDTVLGVPRMNILGWLNRHLYDGYYLGTPFATIPSGFSPESCMYPNGSRRWDGYVGQNCAGFVAHVYQSAGGHLAPIAVNNNHSPWNGGPGGGAYINAWRWYGYAIDSGAHVYTFNTVRDMLASGVVRKGDIIFFMTAPGIDCHIGIFWEIARATIRSGTRFLLAIPLVLVLTMPIRAKLISRFAYFDNE